MIQLLRIRIVRATLALIAAGAFAAVAPNARAACIHSGTQKAINRALHGRGARAVLCRRAMFVLHSPVKFTAADQRVYTQGWPSGATRAHLIVAADNQSGGGVVLNRSSASLTNVTIDGGSPHDSPFARTSAGLISISGGHGQQVKWVDASWPRGGTHLICVGASHITLSHNKLGPGGWGHEDSWPGGPPAVTTSDADGITFSCDHSVVANNTITDATDLGIYVVGGTRGHGGAIGSTIQHNTIVSRNQSPSMGIAVGVFDDDTHPTPDHTGIKIVDNVIDAEGAFMRVGIGIGVRTWCQMRVASSDYPYGATVSGNVLEGPHMGWGIAVSGVRGVSVTGNVDLAQHVGRAWPMPNDWCDLGPADPGLPAPSPPAAFVYDPAQTTGSTLQSGFVTGQLDGLLSSCLPGDVNNDGVIDQTDVALLQATVNSGSPTPELCREDVNGDGVVDQRDVNLLQKIVSGTARPTHTTTVSGATAAAAGALQNRDNAR